MANLDVSEYWSPIQFGALMRKQKQSNELGIVLVS